MSNPDIKNNSGAVRLQDIADRCGVHKTTVGRAIRGDRKCVSQEVIDRIIEVANEMGYDPARNHAARRLSLSKTGKDTLNYMVAVFMPGEFSTAPYYQLMFRGIVEVLWAEGFGLVTHQSAQIDLHPAPYTFARGDIDAAILFATHDDSVGVIREHYYLRRSPIVSLIYQLGDCSSVLADNYGGGYAIAAHLLDLGHKKILYYWNEEGKQPSRRNAGYRQACVDRGLDPDRVLHEIGAWRFFEFASNDEPIISAIQQVPDATAVIAVNDGAAAYIGDVVKRIGLSVPDDISIVGFDDTDPLLDNTGSNILTTVRMPLEEIGREAGKLILRRLSGDADEGETVTVPAELIVRASTAPARPRSS